MRNLLMSTAMVLIAGTASAQDVALVLGTERYVELGRLNRGVEPVDATEGLRAMGFEVLQLANGSTAATDRALNGFVGRAPTATRMVVTLSGRFVTDGDRTWYLTTDAEEPELLDLADTAVSVESIMQIMARTPGSSILMLAYDDSEDQVFDPWLSEGFGELDIPQGVTVLFGGPRQIARFMSDELVRADGDLARLVAANRGISAAGYLPRRMLFIGPGRAADGQVISGGQIQPIDNSAETALWSGAVALDSVAAYQNYLNRYPRGQFAGQARQAIDTIQAEPHRAARLEEDSLQLTRAQRRGIQRNLTLLNFNTRGVDGIFGSGTRNTILNWQQENGYPQNGYLNGEQISRVLGQARRREQVVSEETERRDLEARREENTHWEVTGATGTLAGLRAYLQRYPEGRYASIAETRIAAANAEVQRSSDSVEQTMWENVRSINSVAGYEDYLRSFPSGQFAEEAETRIGDLRHLENGGSDPAISPDLEAQLAAGEQALSMDQVAMRLIEDHLNNLQMNPGTVDGRFDEQTRMAIRRYQNERGMPVTGYINQDTAIRMLSEY